VGLEPTIPTSERVKTVHALDRSATVTEMLLELLMFKCYKLLFCSLFVSRFLFTPPHFAEVGMENK
jgi:hypothetical protein